jgi:hypothetical protein
VGRQCDEQVPPGTLEIECELLPTFGDEDIASSQGDRFTATVDANLAFEVHAGRIHVTARACDVRARMECVHATPGDSGDTDVPDDAGLDLTAQGPLASWLDPYGRDVPAHEISPELRTLPRRDTIRRY